MERNRLPYIDTLTKLGRTDFVAEQKKSAEEVAFWENCLNSVDYLVVRQAKGNIDSARGRLKQLDEYLTTYNKTYCHLD